MRTEASIKRHGGNAFLPLDLVSKARGNRTMAFLFLNVYFSFLVAFLVFVSFLDVFHFEFAECQG